MIALDTNLLIYAHREGSPEHEGSRRAIMAALDDPRGWGICLPSIVEFWNVVTHPKIPGGPSSLTVANHFFHYLLTEGRGNVWTPGAGFGERLMRWAVSLKIRGKRIFDLQIAVIAYEHGVHEIWTHDRDFVSIPSVRVFDPLQSL